MWENSDVGFQFPYKGRYQKLVSILAATASAQFTLLANDLLPSKKGVPVIFDARVWQVPNIDEAYSNFLWRQDDAIKNAVSMAAQAVYSHKELHKKNTDQKLIMLAEKDVHFGSYPEHFKSGAFVKRVSRKCKLTPLEMNLIPEAHRNPDILVERSAYEFFSLTKFNTEASLRKLHAGYFKILFLDKVFNES
jgi:tRNA(His) 5'-end guanylyltransferase